MANTNPVYLKILLVWLRANFSIEEHRPRAKIYLHEGLDLDAATTFWSDWMSIPVDRFKAPY